MKKRAIYRNTTGAEGFTLMEIMVAVTLLALVSLSLWSALRISIASWKRGTEFIDENQRQRATSDLVQKQMASAYGMMAPLDLQSGGGMYPIFLGTESGVQFVSLCSMRFREHPGLTVVTYSVVRDSDGLISLVEREEPYLGVEPGESGELNQVEQGAITVFGHLTGAAFEYFDPGAADIPAQWVREWDAREMRILPAAISISLSTREATGESRIRKLVFPVIAKPYEAMLNFQDPFEGQRRTPRGDTPRTRR